jgi:predicted RNA methylase
MNTLLQGDCRDFAADIKFDAVITDPPYDAQRKEIDWLFELSLRCEVNLIVF